LEAYSFSIAGIATVIAAISIFVGAYDINQCTPFNQLIGNCSNTTGWFVVAGVAVIVIVALSGLAIGMGSGTKPHREGLDYLVKGGG
jgi:hypothetical protein